MEIIIISIAVFAIIIVNVLMGFNVKELEKVALDAELNKIAEKYPENNEICKQLLKKLENSTTQIEENDNSEATIYIAISDKILMGNTHKSFTRIQTIAHECLHSIQDKKMLMFNFIYSNIYLIYFFIICVLVILKKLSCENIACTILLILSFVYYAIRIFLENDAMIKAEYLAMDYIKEQNKSSELEIEKLHNGFKSINKGIIKGTNCDLFTKVMIKVVIFNVLALIF